VVVYEDRLGGEAPYTYNAGTVTYEPERPHMAILSGLCAEDSPIVVTDINDCHTQAHWVLSSTWEQAPTILATTPACAEEANGTMSLAYVGNEGVSYRVTADQYDTVFVSYMSNLGLLDGLSSGDYTVYQIMSMGFPSCAVPVTVEIGSATGPCGEVNGMVFHDENEDCIMNDWDFPIPYKVITVEPIGSYAMTNAAGHYRSFITYGEHDFVLNLGSDEVPACPPSGTASVSVSAADPIVSADLSLRSTVPHDLEVYIWPFNPVVGFPTQGTVSVRNLSAYPSGEVTVTVELDPVLLNPSPTGPITIPVIPPYEYRVVNFSANVPADVDLLGTELVYTATVTNSVAEDDLSNNVAVIYETVVGSYDPNDKLGSTSSRGNADQYFLDQDAWIDYTVRFQNTGTAPAQTVAVRDDIDTDLDIASLEILGASHAFEPSFGDDRELVFTFNDINLPDSSVDLLGSQGFISYRIKPNNDIVVGDILENTADIYFDFNPPITTNTVEHVVELSTGIKAPTIDLMVVAPNPATDLIILRGIGIEALAYLHVLSIDGRSIQSPTRWSGVNLELDIRALAPGTYIVRTPQGQARFVKH